jgi:hypothetical protein
METEHSWKRLHDVIFQNIYAGKTVALKKCYKDKPAFKE